MLCRVGIIHSMVLLPQDSRVYAVANMSFCRQNRYSFHEIFDSELPHNYINPSG